MNQATLGLAVFLTEPIASAPRIVKQRLVGATMAKTNGPYPRPSGIRYRSVVLLNRAIRCG